MPYKDKEKRRAAVRRSKAKRRETPGKPLQKETPEETPVDPIGRPVSVIHWTDADGQARVTRYVPPRADWKGMGWCRDCNVKVPEKDNCCRVCFFTPEKAKLPPVGPVPVERYPVTAETPPWARRPDKRALPDLAAISASLASAKLGDHVRFGVSGPTFAEIAEVLGA